MTEISTDQTTAAATAGAGATPSEAWLAGDECLSIRDGRLRIEEVDLFALAGRFGTPLYVHSEDQLRRNARAAVAAFAARWPEGEVLVMPSLKANFSLALRHVLNQEGVGCDVFGAGELEACLRAGVDPSKVSLNGSSKGRQLLERALAAGVRVTADSVAELELLRDLARAMGCVAHVRVRTRPWLPFEEPTELSPEPIPVNLAIQRYKPGIPTEELLALPRDLREAPELRLSGVMAHIGRQRREPRLWAELAAWLAALVGELNREWEGWRPAEIDLGGGFPTRRDPAAGGHEEPAPPLEDYAEAITEALRAGLREAGVDPAGIQLEVEPGRWLYANTGLHLTTVRHLKQQAEPFPLRWVETDTSEVFLPDLVHEANRWRPIVVNRAAEPPTETADLVGSSCGVEIVVLDAALPPVEPGDVVALLDTGAYQDAGSCNFNALPRPATVLVSGSAAELIKRRETVAEVFSRDLVPARLRSGAAAAPRVTGLDHVSVSSGDLDRSLAFYCDLLGVPLMQRGEAEGIEAGAITGLADSHVRFADLDLGDGRVLELLQFVAPPAPPLGAELHQPGSGHLALRVADADEAHAALTAAGVGVRSGPIELDEPGYWHGARCFYAEDPDGVVVEIVERPPATDLEETTR